MKRTVSFVLALLVLVSAGLFFPRRAEAITVDQCYANHSRCWQLAMSADVGVIKRTLMLTMCDVSLGYCLIRANAV